MILHCAVGTAVTVPSYASLAIPSLHLFLIGIGRRSFIDLVGGEV